MIRPAKLPSSVEENSFDVRDVTSHSPDFILFNRSARLRGTDGIFQFVGGRLRTRPAQIDVPIVDPTVVDQFAIAIEDGYFRSDLHMTHLDQRMLGISQHRHVISELA